MELLFTQPVKGFFQEGNKYSSRLYESDSSLLLSFLMTRKYDKFFRPDRVSCFVDDNNNLVKVILEDTARLEKAELFIKNSSFYRDNHKPPIVYFNSKNVMIGCGWEESQYLVEDKNNEVILLTSDSNDLDFIIERELNKNRLWRKENVPDILVYDMSNEFVNTIVFVNENGSSHHLTQPAITIYDKTGKDIVKMYCLNGEILPFREWVLTPVVNRALKNKNNCGSHISF